MLKPPHGTSIYNIIKNMIETHTLSDMTKAVIHEFSNDYSQENWDLTQSAVIKILHRKGFKPKN